MIYSAVVSPPEKIKRHCKKQKKGGGLIGKNDKFFDRKKERQIFL